MNTAFQVCNIAYECTCTAADDTGAVFAVVGTCILEARHETCFAVAANQERFMLDSWPPQLLIILLFG